MSWFKQRHPRMDEYHRTHGSIPSSLSKAAETVARVSLPETSQPAQKPWWDMSDWISGSRSTSGPYYGGGGSFGYSSSFYRDDEETILDGLLTVSLHRKDVIVVPAGKMDLVPEKYRAQTIELEFSQGYAVIK